ncbi:hypothetical protein PFNF135_06237 [Plasmodium falciparum NF135/5.C10]|uniref:Duffy-binding-like domain-containing protein n=1 Tax=Plasmodium falciparum NF135/5.C10 TaxID=1036726 RepID=W4I6L9_PLAFA|nr:hypothetical protein PFNF135_06237 [Plasmodium falciparum NF135/5.C10]
MAPKGRSTNEIELSARDVLENIGIGIYNQEKIKKNPYEQQLKGTLSNARFHDGLHKAADLGVIPGPSHFSQLYYKKHTNNTKYYKDDRHPCHGRQGKRFDEGQKFECGNDKIIGNSDKYGSCAPPRRRHICDQNLEFLDNNHTDTIHDVLGNVLVTAKYEGESIVNDHPDKKNNGNKSGICTSLARSFADIGDIVRGRDMFKPNDKDAVRHGLKVVFKKIYDKLSPKVQEHYKDVDGSGNYYKLREDWWTANRDQVWKAITYKAPQDANYFRNVSGTTMAFTSAGKCRHNDNSVPTNLDYVPQFLRWYDEWADDFCRIRKIKLGNIKKSCTGESNNKHCSGEGYNCKLSDLKKNNIFMDLECPSCADDCKSYETWVENKKKEFNKQKKKYEKEVDATQNNDNNENGIYNKKFYDELKTSYKEVNSFFELLNKGPICENIDKKIQIDYNDTQKTFSRPDYCKSCPITDILCNDHECKSINEFNCREIKSMPNIRKNENETPIDIDILVNVNKKKVITDDLKNNYENCDLFKKLGKQKWKCKYKCNLDVCEPKQFDSNIYNERYISITVLFKRWLEYFLEDYNKLKEKLNSCMYNGEESVCIKACKKNCECVEKWINIKRSEWDKVRNRYVNQYVNKDDGTSNSLDNFLEQSQFKGELEKAKGDIKDLHQLEKSSECTQSVSRDKLCKEKDIIERLLLQLNKQVDECKKKNNDTNGNLCHDNIPKPLNDEDEDDEEYEAPPKPKPPSTPNPCANGGEDKSGGSGKIKSVTDVAERMHMGAQKQLYGNKGESALKGDMKNAKFKNNPNPNKLDGGKICEINTTHSNDSRRRRNRRGVYNGPCTGKNQERFKIGTDWKDDKFVSRTHNDVYMPPRRQHMCTSNLENLSTSSKGLTGANASDSLLGDVVLAAKMEGQDIKNKLTNNADASSICRALKYSFADLGDIIRGRDMWDKDDGAQKMERILKNVFGTLYKSLEGIRNHPKYADDENNKPPYKLLREDWWEANRHKVWKAMKCEISELKDMSGHHASSSHCGYSHGTPLDDYIPQRLRWMTEWAEWYCKEQSLLYGELVTKCAGCISKGGQCTQKDNDCEPCKAGCEAYKKKIEPWKKQWEKIKGKYEELYKKATTTTDITTSSGPKDEKDVVDFFQKLHEKNSDNTIYSTAAGYVHQEAHINDCNKQNVFCESGDKKNYAFRHQPHEYDEALNCGDREGPKAPKEKKENHVSSGKKKPCDIVEEHFKLKDNKTGGIDSCNPKDYGGTYPPWKCDKSSNLVTDDNVCMPPRRQKLCVINLQHLTENTSDGLRKAFIQCAAAETFLLWHKYKKDKNDNSNNLDNTLKSGTIPEEFKRQMFYTFGDFRDLCLGTDISARNYTISAVKNNIDKCFNKNGDKGKNDNTERKQWWDEIKNDVWEGMLCGLSHHIDEHEREKFTNSEAYQYNKLKDELEDFASRPPFLRWFTEWGDQFCKEHKVEKEKLLDNCREVDCRKKDESHQKIKEQCDKACKKYQEWLQGWKDQYKKQSAKFDKDKEGGKYEGTSAEDDVEYVSSAHDYLHDELQKLCEDGKCSCMEETSTQNDETDLPGQKFLPEALDNPPKGFEDKCECSEPYEPMSCVEKTAKKLRKNAENNIDIKLKGNGNTYNGNCKKVTKDKYQETKEGTCNFKDTVWSECILTNGQCKSTETDRFKVGGEWDCNGKTLDGNNKLCIPPRRKHMCLKNLENIVSTNISDSTELLKKIQDVAKSEGDDIVHKLLAQNPCNESIICDAMKYSFADLADIIRGTNIYKGPNGTNVLEKELKSVFETIYTKWKSENTNNKSKYTDVASFRSAWWDANRKDIWKAMTCSAPKDAHLKKKLNNPADKSPNTDSIMAKQEKCGYDKEPPDYDYIPERYRFLQEWSEYYCKALKEKNDEMKNDCTKCLENGAKCEKEEDKKKCEECNKKCEKYKEFVDKWEVQFEEQNQLYKELYMKAKAASKADAHRDSSIKFIKKLENICDDPHNAKKYLDKSTHCTDYVYSEINSNESSYAFSEYPMGYKAKCNCNKDSFKAKFGNTFPFIRPPVNIPNIPGLNTIKKAVAQIPKRIKNISPDAHTIHELVARSFDYFVPKFPKEVKPPPTHNILNDVLPSAIPVGIALALGSIAFLFIKKKPKSPVDLIRVLDIHKGDYDIPTPKSKNRYIPYVSDTYKGKTYIYMEGDSSGDEKYAFMSDTTDVTSSESEYEEMDINDIYVPGSPKYKTLIEVVLEPSKSDGNIPHSGDGDTLSDMTPTNTFTDEEWNELKHGFISQYIQSESLDVPQYDVSTELPTNTQRNILDVGINEKPFITSIHDRDLYTGEEISYNINMSTNSMDDPKYVSNNVYSGIDLINDTLSGNAHIDIYDEVLKRKENELFGTNYKKNTSNNSVAKLTNSDPIMNQINLLHKWLDRHRDMCNTWNTKEELLDKLNEQWNKEKDGGNVPSDNRSLNTNVSFEIDMDENKGKKEFSNMDTNVDTPTMDTILDDMEDDIYYDVNDDENPFVDDIPMDHNKVDVPKKVHVEMKILNNTFNGSLEPEFPISDVWNI